MIDTSNLNFQESVDEVSRVIVEYMVPKMKFKKLELQKIMDFVMEF